MINASSDKLVFIQTGAQLNESIVAALELASKWILRAYGWEELDLERVNTWSYKDAIFPALVTGFILQKKDMVFAEDYVLAAFELVSNGKNDISPALYSKLTIYEIDGKQGYRRTFVSPLRRGFSAFLIALHIQRAIVLPYKFVWPWGFDKEEGSRKLVRREMCHSDDLPELFRFLRSLNYQEEKQKEPVFDLYTYIQKKRISEQVLHLVIAAGWLNPEDANYDDLVTLYRLNEKLHFACHEYLACLVLADLLEKKYQSRSPITASGWQTRISQSEVARAKDFKNPQIAKESSDAAIVEQAVNMPPLLMGPGSLEKMTHLPGLDVDLAAITKVWLVIENSYFKKVKREDHKGQRGAIGHLNVYLFAYLPYWFAAHPGFPIAFPDSPDKLLCGIFVSDLGLHTDQVKPLALVDFLAVVAAKRQWVNPTHYGKLKQLEVFFGFIERFRDQLPGCAGFQQPLCEHDFPATARSYGTNKRPIPRRIFQFLISYIEALVAFGDVLLTRLLSGEVPDSRMGALTSDHTTIIDCYRLQDLFGFVPVVFHQGKAIPLRRIPNILCIARKCIKGGRDLRIPHPHAMHQILVALYTGLRHNHIQWLDAKTFDFHVAPDAGKSDFAELHVNTDKTKTGAWRSYVNFRVIEILRMQLAWRQLIDEPGFSDKVFYNNNPDSKWGQYYPLFSYFADGRPHLDNLYSRVWNSLLSGCQTILAEIGERDLRLVQLLPSSVPYADLDRTEKLYEYGGAQKRVCQLVLKSDITPHSARVSVVSHAICILPADLIGRYWTGQTEATVYHYVVPDEGEINSEQQRQNLMLRQRGYKQGYEAMLASSPGRTSPFIKADDVNSRLSKSLQTNLEETISAYGCVSLSLSGNTKTGLDVLRETRAVGAVATKTELCPYGSQCPQEVVVALNGFRRCGPCHFAVRSVDHLPAITAKTRQVLEGLTEIEARLDAADAENMTSDEWDALAKNRDMLAEDLAAWQMSAEVLEIMRQRVEAGDSTKTWHIQRPEIIEQHLKRALFPTETTDYLLARLHESEAFPILESPQIRAKFDLLRRNLLANTGNIREALRMEQPTNSAAECRALIRSVVGSHKLGIEDIRRIMDTSDLDATPTRKFRLLPSEASR